MIDTIVTLVTVISFLVILVCAYVLLGGWYDKLTAQVEAARKKRRKQKRLRAIRNTLLWPIRKLGIIRA
jgi:hypothetical protein